MNPDRFKELVVNPETKLTAEEIEQGYFFCCDWDGLLLNKSSDEAKNCCSCRDDKGELKNDT